MAVNNQLANRQTGEVSTRMTFSSYLSGAGVKQQLAASLGSEKAVTKFTSSILSAVSVNPALQKCDFSTVIAAGLLANALDLSLSPSLGYCYIVPFEDKNNGRTVATFIPGYKSYIQLAIRSGVYRKITTEAIKEGELISYNPIDEELKIKLIEDDAQREKAETVGYFAMFELLNGFKKVLYWSKSKMLLHADRYSKAFSLEGTGGRFPKAPYWDYVAGRVPQSEMWKYSSFWYKDFDSMAKKTMLRQLLSRWGLMSIEMQKMYDEDTDAMLKMDNDFDTGSDDEFFFGGADGQMTTIGNVSGDGKVTVEPAQASGEQEEQAKPKAGRPKKQDKHEENGDNDVFLAGLNDPATFVGTPFEG